MTAVFVTAALAADLFTANVARELNPLARAIIVAGFGFAAKAAEAAGVLATVAICRRKYPRLAGLVAGVAVLAGGVGAWSNVG